MKKTNNKNNSINKKFDSIKKSLNNKLKPIKKFINKKIKTIKKNNAIKKENKNKKLDITSIDKKSLKNEINRVKYNSRYGNLLRNTIYSITIIAAVGAILATLILPVLQISGNSMNPSYYNGDIVVTMKTKSISSGDVIAFYHGNKVLIKRVIATAGNWVKIDDKGNVYVNGNLVEENYVAHKQAGDYDIKFPYQVPDGSYFVLSDDREDINDSRLEDIGSIKYENVIGKFLFKVWPIR